MCEGYIFRDQKRVKNLEITDYGRMMAKSLQPKFISQSQIYIPLKCLRNLVFCWNNGWLMENRGIGTLYDEMCADKSTGNTPNIPQFIQPICPNWPIIWVFKKTLSSHVHCPCCALTLCRSGVRIGMKVLAADSIILGTRKFWCMFQIKQNLNIMAAFFY